MQTITSSNGINYVVVVVFIFLHFEVPKKKMKEFWIIFSIFSSCILSWIHSINCRSLVGIGKLKHGPHTAQFDKSQPKMVKSVLGSHAIYFKPHLKGLEEMFASSSERNEQMIENQPNYEIRS